VLPTVILAEFEVWHSRSVAPTRRVALGRDDLPIDPLPGFGGLLLAGIVGAHAPALNEDDLAELAVLMSQVEAGQRIPQTRLRHRLQVDRIGLQKATHQLVGDGEELLFRFADAPPAPQVLAAVYRAGQFETQVRRSLFGLLRSAAKWQGYGHADLLAYLTGRNPASGYGTAVHVDPQAWAMDLMGFRSGLPTRHEVQRRFRKLVRAAHPDSGGDGTEAAARIGALREARNILLQPGFRA
jgi:hypothetical protein